MRIELRADSADQERIPAKGPVVVVANHLYGVLDGALLTILLTRVRPDVKILTNCLLRDVPELRKHSIFVDPFGTDRSIEGNRRALGGARFAAECQLGRDACREQHRSMKGSRNGVSRFAVEATIFGAKGRLEPAWMGTKWTQRMRP